VTGDGFALTEAKDGHRVDSRLMAMHLGAQHRNTFELIKDHEADFEELGFLRFETGEIQGRGQPEKFVLLNEDHCYLLLTYSRNTAKVRTLKVKLVQALRDARRAAEIRQREYLPSYQALHDAIKIAAAGSPNERWLHINANKALNQLAGVQPGQRAGAGHLQQSILAVGSAMAARAVLKARNGRDVHQLIKAALTPLAGVLALPEATGGQQA